MQDNAGITIAEFNDSLAGAFSSLNYAWIRESYTIEPHDREVLDRPYEQIIEKGGQIFFAILEGVPVGTVALMENGNGSFELAKMAVHPNVRKRGIGRMLMQHCIDYALSRRKSEVILESNTKQAAALRLYRSFGFAEVPLDPNSHFKRANIRMRLALSPNNL